MCSIKALFTVAPPTITVCCWGEVITRSGKDVQTNHVSRCSVVAAPAFLDALSFKTLQFIFDCVHNPMHYIMERHVQAQLVVCDGMCTFVAYCIGIAVGVTLLRAMLFPLQQFLDF